MYECQICGDIVDPKDFRAHLCAHNPNADNLDSGELPLYFRWVDSPEGGEMILGTGKIDIKEAIRWQLYKQSLQEALIDNIRHNIDIPDEFVVTWTGHVEITTEQGIHYFKVTIYKE